MTVYLKYEPDCSEANRIDLFNSSFTINETEYIYDYYPYDIDCSYYGTADFYVPYGDYQVQISQCPEYAIYNVSVYSDCATFTPQNSEGNYVNVAFFTAGSSDGLVTITINGNDDQKYMQAFSSYPDDCYGSGAAIFYLPAGRYFVRYGDMGYPYRYGEYMNFHYDCNVRQLYY